MNTRTTRTLIVLAVALGLGNPAEAVITSAERVPDSQPVMLVLMLIPWLVGAELLRRGKTAAGTIVVGLLALLDVVSFPGWKRTSALDWATQSLAASLAAASLGVAIAVLVGRRRGMVATGASR